MTIVLPFLSLFVAWAPNSSAVEPDHFLQADLNNPAALEEATRVLVEEVKLASRPNTYLVVDLVANALIMKARGVELQRLPFSKWSAASREAMTGIYRLAARPSVVRRKIDPSVTPEQAPIALADMPVHYHLDFTPSLAIDVIPPVDRAPLRWTMIQATIWGRWLRSWFRSLSSEPVPPQPCLVLTLPEFQLC